MFMNKYVDEPCAPFKSTKNCLAVNQCTFLEDQAMIHNPWQGNYVIDKLM